MTTSFHTIIIGAGPGGLSCARRLAEKGKQVLVLEKNQTIGPKVCAGGITLAGTASSMAPQLIEKQFRCQHISSARQQLTLRHNQPIVSTINRARLGRWMAKQALAAGATILTSQRVRQIDQLSVTTAESTFSAQFLVGADGADSLVRRHLGLPSTHLGTGLQYHLEGNFPRMVWHLDPQRFNTGYAWIFPQEGRASVGAYVCKQHLRPSQLRQGLHQWMAEQGLDYGQASPEAAHINFDYRGWQFGSTFLVGDAAGLASGLTGEGILPAIISGQEVAAKILKPDAASPRLQRLLKNHRRHSKLLLLAGRHQLLNKLIIEVLIVALRLELLHFSSLEMAR